MDRKNGRDDVQRRRVAWEKSLIYNVVKHCVILNLTFASTQEHQLLLRLW